MVVNYSSNSIIYDHSNVFVQATDGARTPPVYPKGLSKKFMTLGKNLLIWQQICQSHQILITLKFYSYGVQWPVL